MTTNPIDTQVNIPLLRKAVEWAEAEAAKPPELCEWEQSVYLLPSPMDLPLATGISVTGVEALGKSMECGTCFCVAGKVAYDTTGNLDYLAAPAIAQTALGLTDFDRGRLFNSMNTIADVRRIAEEIAGERL